MADKIRLDDSKAVQYKIKEAENHLKEYGSMDECYYTDTKLSSETIAQFTQRIDIITKYTKLWSDVIPPIRKEYRKEYHKIYPKIDNQHNMSTEDRDKFFKNIDDTYDACVDDFKEYFSGDVVKCGRGSLIVDKVGYISLNHVPIHRYIPSLDVWLPRIFCFGKMVDKDERSYVDAFLTRFV